MWQLPSQRGRENDEDGKKKEKELQLKFFIIPSLCEGAKVNAQVLHVLTCTALINGVDLCGNYSIAQEANKRHVTLQTGARKKTSLCNEHVRQRHPSAADQRRAVTERKLRAALFMAAEDTKLVVKRRFNPK